jgi:hypothetical protein
MAKKRAKKAKPAKKATAKRSKKAKAKPVKRAKAKKPSKKAKKSVAKRPVRKARAVSSPSVPTLIEHLPSGQPGGGQGRVDFVGNVPEGVRVDPYITEGHPGYEEKSSSSELWPAQRQAKSEPAW